MKTSSAKAKGRLLQQYARDKIIETFPSLTLDDVRSTSMGAGGEDILLSTSALALFPYSVECKNQQKFTPVYNAYEQAQGHAGREPVVVLKMNRKQPLVVISAEHFFSLVKENK